MAFNMELLMSHLGKPGRYQLLVCLLLCLNYAQVCLNHLCMAFFAAPPLSYRCGADGAANSSGGGIDKTKGSCSLLDSDVWCEIRDNCSSCNADTPYVTEEREWTIVTEFDLVCDRQYLSNLATSIYFLGAMLGGVIFGHISDSIGRFPVLIFCMYVPSAVGVGHFFAQSYGLFAALRFIMGFLIQGLQNVSISLTLEYFSLKHRAAAVIVLSVFWGFGVFLLALIALLIRDWRWMQLCFSLLTLLTLFYVWLLPESLRWLLSKRKHVQAEKLANRIAKFNGLKEVPAEVTVILKDHKFVSSFYYGLNLSTELLYGSKYINMVIAGAVEMASSVLIIFLLKFFGRRRTVMGYFLVGGTACILAGLIEDKTAKTALALLGRFGMGGAANLLTVFTPELYPTLIRNAGLGSCVFWSRVGILLAPQLNLLGTVTYRTLPVILFGALAMLAAMLCLVLPETKDRDLPDTVEESENMEWGCSCKTYSSENYELPRAEGTEQYTTHM